MLLPIKTHQTTWTPNASDFKVTLNIALDGCIVPTQSGTARVDYSRLVVLDNFIDEPTRCQLFEFLTAPSWAGSTPPASKWDRVTADADGKPLTWGLHGDVLQVGATYSVRCWPQMVSPNKSTAACACCKSKHNPHAAHATTTVCAKSMWSLASCAL